MSRSELLKLKGNGIYFKGYVSNDELLNYYKNALALVYPSLYEGFGLPILEAMSLGVPVITSDRAPMPEVAGEAAIYVDPEDESSIKSAMERLVNDEHLRKSLKSQGFERSKKFDCKSAAQKTIRAYEVATKNSR